jgi:hypothetical protein
MDEDEESPPESRKFVIEVRDARKRDDAKS